MQTYAMLKLHQVDVSELNPRKAFEGEPMEELKISIKEHGIIEPLIVRMTATEGKYELVAGERRFRAAKDLELEEVPCIIRQIDDDTMRELMLLENLQREDLAPLEVASALEQLLASGPTQEELGKKIGKSQSWISNHLRLLRAPEDLKQLLISREITPKHANVLLPIAGDGRYPAYGRAMETLKRESRNGPVSVKRLEGIVDETLGNDYSGERVLNFTCPGWHHREVLPYMDRAKCDGCQHLLEIKMGRGKNKVCLYSECFQAAIQAAKGKREKERQAERAAMLDSPDAQTKGIDLELLNYTEYDQLSRARFDLAECQGCEHKRQTQTGAEVCLKPECFREKTEQHRLAARAVEAEWENKASEAANAHLAGRSGPLNDRELRLIMEAVAASYGFDPLSIIEPWIPDAEECEVDDAQTCVDAIPDADLPKALLALVLSSVMEGYGTDHEDLTARINELHKPSEHVVRLPAVLTEEEDEEEEQPAGTCRHWCCPEDEDPVEAKDRDAALLLIGCLDCELLHADDGCEGPEEVRQ